MSPARPEASRVATKWRTDWVQINVMMPPMMKFDLFVVAEAAGAWSGQDWIRRTLAEAMFAAHDLSAVAEVSPLLGSPTPGRWRHDGYLTDPARTMLPGILLDEQGT